MHRQRGNIESKELETYPDKTLQTMKVKELKKKTVAILSLLNLDWTYFLLSPVSVKVGTWSCTLTMCMGDIKSAPGVQTLSLAYSPWLVP